MMNIIHICAAIFVSFGFGLTIFSKETDKRRYIGWLIMATSISIFGICKFITGEITSAIFDVGIGLVDYWLAYFWYGKYEESQQMKIKDKKERFLKEILNFKR